MTRRKPRGLTVSGVCCNLDYLDLRRFCSTKRAVILPSVRMLNRAGEELSPVWGITPDACAVGAGVAVTVGCAVGAGVAGAAVAVLSAGAVVGAAVGAGDADGAGVGVTVGSGEGSGEGFGSGEGSGLGSGEGFGGSYFLALISWAAFSASPRPIGMVIFSSPPGYLMALTSSQRGVPLPSLYQ